MGRGSRRRKSDGEAVVAGGGRSSRSRNSYRAILAPVAVNLGLMDCRAVGLCDRHRGGPSEASRDRIQQQPNTQEFGCPTAMLTPTAMAELARRATEFIDGAAAAERGSIWGQPGGPISGRKRSQFRRGENVRTLASVPPRAKVAALRGRCGYGPRCRWPPARGREKPSAALRNRGRKPGLAKAR